MSRVSIVLPNASVSIEFKSQALTPHTKEDTVSTQETLYIIALPYGQIQITIMLKALLHLGLKLKRKKRRR
jgi:hypothetical protein